MASSCRRCGSSLIVREVVRDGEKSYFGEYEVHCILCGYVWYVVGGYVFEPVNDPAARRWEFRERRLLARR